MASTMPPEWSQHARTWMAFPPSGPSAEDLDDRGLHEVRAAWAAVANAVVGFEPVTMLVDPADVDLARTLLDPTVVIETTTLDDAWMRDMGPTFVHGDSGEVRAIDWVFNGWGAQSWASWDNDQHVAQHVATLAGTHTESSLMVNEGGGIHVDGEGTVLVTETVQLDPSRNPDWTREQVEAELRRTLGVERVVWLRRGLTRDCSAYPGREVVLVDARLIFSRGGGIHCITQQQPVAR